MSKICNAFISTAATTMCKGKTILFGTLWKTAPEVSDFSLVHKQPLSAYLDLLRASDSNAAAPTDRGI